ncbi:MAG: hypothetical protein ABIS07_01110 [Dokdonella sp.]
MRTRDNGGVRPAELAAHASDTRAPFAEQGFVDVDADGFEYRADIGEVEIEPGEAARIVERQ